jgi:hypothetical protein
VLLFASENVHITSRLSKQLEPNDAFNATVSFPFGSINVTGLIETVGPFVQGISPVASEPFAKIGSNCKNAPRWKEKNTRNTTINAARMIRVVTTADIALFDDILSYLETF